MVDAVPTSTSAPRGDDVRRALLSAAHDLLAAEGPGALTVRRIAAAANVSTMNVYSRFGGKDGVLEELFIDGFTRLDATMATDEPTDDPIGDLRRCGRRYRAFAKANPTYYSLMFEQVTPDFEPSETAKAAALVGLAQVVGRVERAMSLGAIAEGDPLIIASGLWAAAHGLVSLEMRHTDDDICSWDDVSDHMLEALLRGFATPA